jgi:hypothetical protein
MGHTKGRQCTIGIGQGKESKNLNVFDVLSVQEWICLIHIFIETSHRNPLCSCLYFKLEKVMIFFLSFIFFLFFLSIFPFNIFIRNLTVGLGIRLSNRSLSLHLQSPGFSPQHWRRKRRRRKRKKRRRRRKMRGRRALNFIPQINLTKYFCKCSTFERTKYRNYLICWTLLTYS